MEMLKTGHPENDNFILKEQIRGIQERYEHKISELSVLHELGRAIINVHDFNKLCEAVNGYNN